MTCKMHFYYFYIVTHKNGQFLFTLTEWPLHTLSQSMHTPPQSMHIHTQSERTVRIHSDSLGWPQAMWVPMGYWWFLTWRKGSVRMWGCLWVSNPKQIVCTDHLWSKQEKKNKESPMSPVMVTDCTWYCRGAADSKPPATHIICLHKVIVHSPTTCVCNNVKIIKVHSTRHSLKLWNRP